MLFTNFCGNKWKDGEFSWMGEADAFLHSLSLPNIKADCYLCKNDSSDCRLFW